MKVFYIITSIIPSRFANSVHAMKMSQALADNGNETILIVPDRKNERPRLVRFEPVPGDLPGGTDSPPQIVEGDPVAFPWQPLIDKWFERKRDSDNSTSYLMDHRSPRFSA